MLNLPNAQVGDVSPEAVAGHDITTHTGVPFEQVAPVLGRMVTVLTWVAGVLVAQVVILTLVLLVSIQILLALLAPSLAGTLAGLWLLGL